MPADKNETGLTMVFNTYAAQISDEHKVIADLYLVDRDCEVDVARCQVCTP